MLPLFATSLGLAFLASSVSIATTPQAQKPFALVSSSSKTVIIQMFEWNWDSIASECTSFIGPAGYGYVQVSPAQEHVEGPQWWTDYQPVSYDLTSKRGNRLQYQNMINQCHSAGVGVIADTIFNHMAGAAAGKGVAGSTFTHYNYPGIYQFQDFHHCGLQPGDNIVNYNSRLEVQTCQLVGLADLATDMPYVQHRLATYANDLLSLGVDGLRLDAAKHIATSEIATILGLLSRKTYITQEVIQGDGEPIQPWEYVGNGEVQEFRYTRAFEDAFLNGNIAALQDLENRGWLSGNQANVFVANHDTERNGGSLNVNSPSNTYILATIYSLAHPYGTPTVLSSYSFSNSDHGAPNGGTGTCSGAGGTGGWYCQHRFTAIAGMTGFRNNVGSVTMTNWVSPKPDRVAFGRGSLGYVAINNDDVAWTATFSTSLPDAMYCDVISGSSSSGSCTGKTIVVSSGNFNATIAPRTALAIHTEAKGTGSLDVAVTFIENAETSLGEDVFLAGSSAELGTWSPWSSVPLSAAAYPNWTTTLYLPSGSSVQYKFLRKEVDGRISWESDPNRQLTVASSGSQKVSTSWR